MIYKIVDDDEEVWKYNTDSAQSAALKWVEEIDLTCDYTFSNGERNEKICVLCPNGEKQFFNVWARKDVEYVAVHAPQSICLTCGHYPNISNDGPCAKCCHSYHSQWEAKGDEQ